MAQGEAIDCKSIRIELLREDHKLTDFCCGNKDIDDFIQKEAWDFQNERLGVSYVFSHKDRIVGFVTLSMADLKREKMEKEDKLEIGKENYPALQISQLAVLKMHERKKIGTFLCDFCLNEAYHFSEKVGCRFLVLNAVPDSIRFYLKYGFKMLPNQKGRREPVMFLNIFDKKQVEI